MKQVEELIERTKLTPKEITKAWDSGNRSQDGSTALDRIAQVQQNKIFKDPGLALIVKKELPRHWGDWRTGTNNTEIGYKMGFGDCREQMLKWHNESVVYLAKEVGK